MKPRTPLKVLTVGIFMLLIAAFVLYRSGYFDKKPAAGAVASATADSTDNPHMVKIDSFWMDPMMSSSKSMHITSPVPVLVLADSAAVDSLAKTIPSK